jgi:hypothetical protein
MNWIAAWRNRLLPVRLTATGDPAHPEAMRGELAGAAMPLLLPA